MDKSVRKAIFKLGLILISFLILTSCKLDNTLNGSISESTPSTDEGLSVSLVKMTDSAPILAASGTSIDTFYYLMSLGSWQPYTFTYDGEVYFSIPTKYGDAGNKGWHLTFATWDPGDTSANWVDADIAPGVQETLNKYDLDSNGFILGSFANARLVQDGSQVKGYVMKWYSSSEYTFLPANGYYSTGFQASDFSSIDPSSILVPTDPTTGAGGFISKIFDDSDDTWKGNTRRSMDVKKFGGLFYIYLTTRNSPTNDTNYISVLTTSDFISFSLPTNYILENYERPEVFEYLGQTYMVAFNNQVDMWQLIPGSSPTEFDTSKSVNIDIGGINIGTGGWDSSAAFSNLPNGVPIIAGVEVVDGRVWLFYLAGGDDPAHFNAIAEFGSVPYSSARGIGVFELIINNN